MINDADRHASIVKYAEDMKAITLHYIEFHVSTPERFEGHVCVSSLLV